LFTFDDFENYKFEVEVRSLKPVWTSVMLGATFFTKTAPFSPHARWERKNIIS